MRRRSALLLPLLLVGSVLYWTVALGLGGVSLALIGVSGDDLELTPPEVSPPRVSSGEPILVHLQSWSDAQATSTDDLSGVSESEPAGSASEAVSEASTDSASRASDDREPGRTAY